MLQADILKAKNLSNQLKSLGYAPKAVRPVKKVRPTPFKFDYEALKPVAYQGKDGKTPTTDELVALMIPLIEARMPKSPTFEITQELVKEIVQVMHSLPEGDKLEVSKGIRNAQSFIYNGKKYGVHEMMHGGSSGSTTTNVFGEIVAGSGTSFTLANTPVSGTVRLYGSRNRLYETTDYSITGASITTILSWSAGDILADYEY